MSKQVAYLVHAVRQGSPGLFLMLWIRDQGNVYMVNCVPVIGFPTDSFSISE